MTNRNSAAPQQYYAVKATRNATVAYFDLYPVYVVETFFEMRLQKLGTFRVRQYVQ